MEAIFDWARIEGHFNGENPCSGIKRVLKPHRQQPVHFPALHWKDVPSFYAELTERAGTSAAALRFIILTACRSREAREAQWSEITDKTWTIHETRAKGRKVHRVPLSDEALCVIEEVRGMNRKFLFPNPSTGRTRPVRPLSVNVFRSLYSRMGISGLTTHEFRSSFRDWCSEYAQAPREVAEQSLTHSLGPVERAYRRSDLFAQRTKLMQSWSDYILRGPYL